MNRLDIHCTHEQIQAHIDRQLPASEEELVGSHIVSCQECRTEYESMVRLDSSLRSLPMETVSSGFTRNVMDQVSPEKTSFAFRALENLAYLFGLFLVLAITAGVLIWTGAVDATQVSQGRTVMAEAFTGTRNALGSGLDAVTAWLVRHIPFAFAGSSVMISMFGILIAGALGIADRLVGRRVLHRFR
jgi:anti-sigma factor RsiW